ncbi:scavenger receptor cysteine-rich type 1 protein M160 [Polymixia lowei]
MRWKRWVCLSTLYTNSCTSTFQNRHFIKYADDTALVSLLYDEEQEHGLVFDFFLNWCKQRLILQGSDNPCKGYIEIYNNGKWGIVGIDNWIQENENVVCKSIGCGESLTSMDIIRPNMNSIVWLNEVTCNGTEAQLWHCSGFLGWGISVYNSDVVKEITCRDHPTLRLRGGDNNVCAGNLEVEEGNVWKPVTCQSNLSRPDINCKQMRCGTNVTQTPTVCDKNQPVSLNCSDKIKVTLMEDGKPSDCFGAVYIDGLETLLPVCGTDWDQKDGEVVCKELGCGKLIDAFVDDGRHRGILDHVSCSGKEDSLWHCMATYDRSLTCSSTAHVVCAGSLRVRLSDGPDECAGRVEIKHKGQWKKPVEKGWTDENSDVVCNDLDCGNAKRSASREKFTKGSSQFLHVTVTCTTASTNISDCQITNTIKPKSGSAAAGITCQKHKVVFLKGEKSCSGYVGIEKEGKDYWLTGSEESWNQYAANAVCRQMHCGDASNFTSALRSVVKEDGMDMDVWEESYSCSSTEASLFKCPKTRRTPPKNDSIAFVSCSVETTVRLKDNCWGKVEVCRNEECGGVCADAWTRNQSIMLCKELGCGDAILSNLKMKGKVAIKSMHMTQQTTKLADCNLVKNEGDYCNDNPAYVVCSGSVKTNFKVSRDHCSGNLEMFYKGQLLPVCDTALTSDVQNTLCRELGCGQAVKLLKYFGPRPEHTKTYVSKLKCPQNSNSSAECEIDTQTSSCTPSGLQCSDWQTIKLKMGGRACEGAVFVHSDEKSAVSAEGWTAKEGSILCQDLNCGKYINHTVTELTNVALWGNSFNCTNVKDPRNIWDCQREKQPSLNNQLYVQCEENLNVKLSNTCFGEVKVNGVGVCDSHWNDSWSQIVCQEQKCSNAIVTSSKTTAGSSPAYHFDCGGFESKLGQCKTVSGRCDGGLVSVYCAGAVQFDTTEKCGGTLIVSYRGYWEYVCPLSNDVKSHLCTMLNCGEVATAVPNKEKNYRRLETELVCSDQHLDVKYCVRTGSCHNKKPAEIYCTKYVPTVPPSLPVKMIVALSLGALCLIIVIVLSVFLRKCILNKGKRISARRETAFESGDYEDVGSNGNEMRFVAHTGPMLNAPKRVVKEEDVEIASSSSYDDIADEEEAATQPLTSGDHGAVTNDSEDALSYEVEDLQESYDDVATGPEILEMAAEVHVSPKAKSASDPEARTAEILQDEDYLEPDQEGVVVRTQQADGPASTSSSVPRLPVFPAVIVPMQLEPKP